MGRLLALRISLVRFTQNSFRIGNPADHGSIQVLDVLIILVITADDIKKVHS
jgi:hypothetical protein